jgi:hypothetical protein
LELFRSTLPPFPELVEAEISALFSRLTVLAFIVKLPEFPVPVALPFHKMQK